MNAEERKRWAVSQRVIGRDHDDAAELISDFMAEPNLEAAAIVVAQWVHKIRIEGALWALSGNIEEFTASSSTLTKSES